MKRRIPAALTATALAALGLTALPSSAEAANAANAGDAYVSKAAPNTNYANANPEKILRETATAGQITYLKFTSTDAGTATVTVYFNTSATGNVELHATGSGWTETGLTWANRPAVGVLLDTRPLPASTGYVTFQAGTVPAGESDFAVVSASTATKSQAMVSEEGSNAAQRPTLAVTPTPPPTTTAAPTTAPPTTPPPTTEPPPPTTPAPTITAPPAGVFGVKVTGNLLTSTLDGSTVQLRGVNRSGTEYACTEGWGIFDGPVATADLQRIKDWGANAVRVSLEQDCWLSTAVTGYQGAPYRQAITDYVNRITALGMYVIIDEHGHGSCDNCQDPMPDSNTALFWGGNTATGVPGVATTFDANPAVLFDMFNEPYPDGNANTAAAWATVTNGMVPLVNAARAHSDNVIMVGGPQYAGDLDGPDVAGYPAGSNWLTMIAPLDPTGQIAASIHIYYDTLSSPFYAPCAPSACWDTEIAPVAAAVPVVMGEIGEHDCTFTLIDGSYDGAGGQQSLVAWADAHKVSVFAWSWIVGSASSCADGPTLITAWTGTPTVYGSGYRAWLLGPH